MKFILNIHAATDGTLSAGNGMMSCYRNWYLRLFSPLFQKRAETINISLSCTLVKGPTSSYHGPHRGFSQFASSHAASLICKGVIFTLLGGIMTPLAPNSLVAGLGPVSGSDVFDEKIPGGTISTRAQYNAIIRAPLNLLTVAVLCY
jgi:hypothetical protein